MRVVGFSTARRIRGQAWAEGEVETSTSWMTGRENQALAGLLLRASAQHLAAMGCKSAFAWVLRDNPRFFLRTPRRQTGRHFEHHPRRRLGLPQTAYAWDPIERLINETV